MVFYELPASRAFDHEVHRIHAVAIGNIYTTDLGDQVLPIVIMHTCAARNTGEAG